MKHSPFLRFLLLLLTGGVLLLAGCRSSAPETESESVQPAPIVLHSGPWTPTQFETEFAGVDPIEGFNRCMFTVNDFCMDYVARPVGWVYCSILPRPLIEMIDRACINLEYPGRLFSCLGRAEWRGSWDETARFFINTTVGIAGFFDPAGNWWDFYSTDSDFGQMFAAWGIGPGCTLVLPFCKQINVRDTVGGIFDIAFDGKTYIPFAGWATGLNRLVVGHRSYKSVIDANADKYKTFRELSVVRRELMLRMWFYHARNRAAEYRKAVNKGEVFPKLPADRAAQVRPDGVKARWATIPNYFPQTSMLDTLRSTMFRVQRTNDYWYMRLAVFNSDFEKESKDYSLRLFEERDKAEYCFWNAPKPEKDAAKLPERLVFIIPGIGGNNHGMSTLAMAELFQRNGYKVVSIDSPFSWRFMKTVGNGKLPGYTPADVKALRAYLKAIREDLTQRELIDKPETVVVGWSFGALHTLHLAALEEKEDTLGIERYVAINPPVDLAYALDTADRMNQVSAKWNREQAIEQLLDAAGKQMVSLMGQVKPQDPELPPTPPYPYLPNVSEEQATFLAALSFKMELRNLLFTAHMEQPQEALFKGQSWGERNRLYDEIDQVTFRAYVDQFLLKRFSRGNFDTLAAYSGLRAIAPSLEGNSRVRVIHNYDDFLINDSDRKFLDSTLGNRLLWFDRGGHLGNLYVTTVQQSILKAADQSW